MPHFSHLTFASPDLIIASLVKPCRLLECHPWCTLVGFICIFLMARMSLLRIDLCWSIFVYFLFRPYYGYLLTEFFCLLFETITFDEHINIGRILEDF